MSGRGYEELYQEAQDELAALGFDTDGMPSISGSHLFRGIPHAGGGKYNKVFDRMHVYEQDQDTAVTILGHEGIHRYFRQKHSTAELAAYTLLNCHPSPNVEEAAGQFWNLWHTGLIDDQASRNEWFNRIARKYIEPPFDPKQINQYLAQGLQRYDTADGTREERAREAMAFFDDQYYVPDSLRDAIRHRFE